ncbi:Microperfuranone synthase [Lachnellula suecica]|uniref:Microperfuranone synthase n=1 Tax=Lachnellula suecica TaxID=602035 RepID=A0A8T9CEP7_9HELO|nr:Microperfuranone synthase [Lachnellula suecica]
MAPHKLEDSPDPVSPLEQNFFKEFKSSKISPDDSPLGLVQNLSQLLARAAATDAGLIYYTTGTVTQAPFRLSYAQLLGEAKEKLRLLYNISGISQKSIVLLHFDSQRENIAWFWACTLGGFLPAISTPLVADAVQRKKHLLHLQSLLNQPIILTTTNLVPEYLGVKELSIHAIESLVTPDSHEDVETPGPLKSKDDIAVLMLTSGSTGNAKAVPLRHGQLIAALKGKSEHHGTKKGDIYLNWTGLDHVASLTEIHLHAMSLSSDQIHVPASKMPQDPLEFVRLLDAHKVVYTFAPNFFLTKLRDSLISAGPSFKADLSHLRAFISGGFGMTETCAGSIYSKACPSQDLARNLEFANLGTCIPGLEMRVMKTDGSGPAKSGETGHLQVHGPVLFDHYFNNPEATKVAFTSDGWFETGDLAYIDEQGNLNLTGRTKDTIILNGVKWSSTEIETAIEEEGIAGLVPSFTVAFPHRAQNSATEDICVVYSPNYPTDDGALRFETATAISKTVSLICGKKPDHLIPLPIHLLEKSSLGKISRTKVRAAFEKGEYALLHVQDAAALARHRASVWQDAKTKTEKTVQATLAELLKISPKEISMKSSIFELGVDSFNLIILKAMLQKTIDIEIDIPVSVLLTEPDIGSISAAIDSLLSKPIVYDPIVPLQRHGTKTPLFCIHPGSGDILVFIALAAHFPTRPVYAIRTRGYNPNEKLFTSIQETADTYASHIRKTQPEGPYAIAGYSLGSTLAYEVGKVLEAQGQQVKFLASIDYPPHIKRYICGLDWVDVLLHIAFFLELIDEVTMVDITPKLHAMASNADALAYILEIGDKERATALAIDAPKLELISDIAENFRVNVETYEPIGQVTNLDVFVADPPTYAANGRKDWRDNKLGKWADFSRTETVFWDCPGTHAKMLNAQHMAEFAKIFKRAMKRRALPGEGHTYPLITIASSVAQRGYTIFFHGGAQFEADVLRMGAKFSSIPSMLEPHPDPVAAMALGKAFVDSEECGVPLFTHGLANFLYDTMPLRTQLLEDELVKLKERYPARQIIIVHELCSMNVVPFVYGRPLPKGFEAFPKTIGIGACNIASPSVDTAPFSMGMPFDTSRACILRNKELHKLANQGPWQPLFESNRCAMLAAGCTTVPEEHPISTWYTAPDVCFQMCSPSMEYPLSDMPPKLSFAGCLPPKISGGEFNAPSWWDDVLESAGKKKIVLVSQGTAHVDYSQLVQPTMEAFRGRDYILTIATLGVRGATLGDGFDVPENARWVDFLSYDRILPHVDVFVCNKHQISSADIKFAYFV